MRERRQRKKKKKRQEKKEIIFLFLVLASQQHDRKVTLTGRTRKGELKEGINEGRRVGLIRKGIRNEE